MATTPRDVRPATLTHLDARGAARMVDVGDKPDTAREAIAPGHVTMSAEARRLVRRAADLIPLGHPLALTSVAVDLRPTRTGYAIEARARARGQTGVEMEALTAVSVAALTLYDMVKAVDRAMVIGDVCLVEKRGGKSGAYRRR